MQLIDQLQAILRSLSGFGPEVLLSVAVAVVTLTDLVLIRRAGTTRRRALYGLTGAAVLGAGMLAPGAAVRGNGFLFGSLLFLDGQAVFFKLICTLAALIALGHAWTSTPEKPARIPDSPARYAAGQQLPLDWLPIFLALLLGLYLMTMSVNLLAIYLSIELVSISSYLLTALTANRKAAEGGIKYLLFGAVSSAIMLYGMSLLYGLTGTLDLTSSVVQVELAKNNPLVIYLAGFLTLSGVLFKLSSVPFHVWTPDSYEAAPMPVAAFFSVGPKAAALLVLMRILTALPVTFQVPLAAVALASITLSNLSALWQTDGKRLLAYSSIAHAGFLLVGVVAFNETGFEAATFYAATYLFMTMGAFLLIDLLGQQRGGRTDLPAFSGQGSAQPLIGIATTVVMVGLTGLPPTVGFTAKLLAFSALWEAYQSQGGGWLLALFALGLLNAVVSLFYYLKIPYLLFFKTPTDHRPPISYTPMQWLLLAILVVPVVLLFFKPDLIMTLITEL